VTAAIVELTAAVKTMAPDNIKALVFIAHHCPELKRFRQCPLTLKIHVSDAVFRMKSIEKGVVAEFWRVAFRSRSLFSECDTEAKLPGRAGGDTSRRQCIRQG